MQILKWIKSRFHIFVFRCCGGLLIYTLGYFLGPQWKFLAFICCPVPILAFLASMYSPQSPVFLVSHGEEPEALSAIKKLYGPQYDSNMELTMIKKAGIYRRSIFEIRPNILIGLQKLRLRPKDRSRLFIYLIFLRQFS